MGDLDAKDLKDLLNRQTSNKGMVSIQLQSSFSARELNLKKQPSDSVHSEKVAARSKQKQDSFETETWMLLFLGITRQLPGHRSCTAKEAEAIVEQARDRYLSDKTSADRKSTSATGKLGQQMGMLQHQMANVEGSLKSLDFKLEERTKLGATFEMGESQNHGRRLSLGGEIPRRLSSSDSAQERPSNRQVESDDDRRIEALLQTFEAKLDSKLQQLETNLAPNPDTLKNLEAKMESKMQDMVQQKLSIQRPRLPGIAVVAPQHRAPPALSNILVGLSPNSPTVTNTSVDPSPRRQITYQVARPRTAVVPDEAAESEPAPWWCSQHPG